MTVIQQRLRWWLDSLGWMGLAGFALLTSSALAYAITILPGQEEIAQLDQALIEERLAARDRDTDVKTREQSAKRNIDMLYRDFPTRLDASKILRQLYAAADNSNLVLQRGIYKPVRDNSSPFLRYEIELPVQGTYPEIQLFTYQALREIPALALDEISFKRENPAQTLLQAKLHFTLYMAENR